MIVVTESVYPAEASWTRTENRLTRSVFSRVQTDYVYDGHGTLIQKSVTQGSATTTTKYAGDLYEQKVAGGQTTITKYYLFGGRRVAMRQGGTLSYLCADHLGSTTLILNTSGGVVSSEKFYSYGLTRSGGTGTDKKFTGHQKEGDLYFMKARFYDPLLGRFMSADSIVPDPANPQSMNRRDREPAAVHGPERAVLRGAGLFDGLSGDYAAGDLGLHYRRSVRAESVDLRAGDLQHRSVALRKSVLVAERTTQDLQLPMPGRTSHHAGLWAGLPGSAVCASLRGGTDPFS
jgi:RHS repeat-associated protein